MLSMSPDYFDVNKDNEGKIQEFKRFLASLPDIPDQPQDIDHKNEIPAISSKDDNIRKSTNNICNPIHTQNSKISYNVDELEVFELEESKEEIGNLKPSIKAKSAFCESEFLTESTQINRDDEKLFSNQTKFRSVKNEKFEPKTIKENEPVSMMDLVRQMHENQKENCHPNKSNSKSPNDSFSSDDVLDVLESKDYKEESSQKVLNNIDRLTEEELTSKIESLLLPNINPGCKLSKLDEFEEEDKENKRST